MKNVLISIVSMILASYCFGQEMNRTVMDEKSQKEILIGYCDRSGLMTGDFGTSYTEEHSVYTPDDASLNLLKGKLNDITFIVVLGTWCGDSKEQVPRFIKILDCLKYDLNNVTFIGVDRTKTAGDVAVAEFKVEKVPTFIILRDGAEIGRIIETPEVNLEKDLVKYIAGGR